MYFTHHCTKNGNEINRYILPNSPCFNHLNCLAKGIDFIFNFGKYMSHSENRLSVLQHATTNEIEVIGYVDKEGIRDKASEMCFSFEGLHENGFTVEYAEVEIKTKNRIILNKRRNRRAREVENGMKSLARIIVFLSHPLGAHYSKVRYKEAILIKNGQPMYVINENGIFSLEGNELINFWQFNIPIELGFRI